MEIILVLAAIVVFALLIKGSGKSETGSRPPQSTPSSSQPIERRFPKTKPTAVTPRFDEKSAKHLAHTRVLTGAAYITDGDTLKIKNIQVRLFGVDAPELDHPYGKQAKWALHKLCKGHMIRAEISDEDEYGRTVAQCFLPDGRDLSAEMVKCGLALDWPKYSGGKYTHLEPEGARKKHWKAAARQRGHMHVFHK